LAWLEEWCWHGLLTPVPRVERARPASDEFLAIWRFDQTRAVKAAMAAGAEAARAVEGVTECAPHPAHALSHACVCARDTGVCNMPWVQQRRCWRRTLREREQRERRVGDGAGSSGSEAGRAHEGDGGDMGCVGVDGKYIGKLQQDRSEHAMQLSPALPSGV